MWFPAEVKKFIYSYYIKYRIIDILKKQFSISTIKKIKIKQKRKKENQSFLYILNKPKEYVVRMYIKFSNTNYKIKLFIYTDKYISFSMCDIQIFEIQN